MFKRALFPSQRKVITVSTPPKSTKTSMKRPLVHLPSHSLPPPAFTHPPLYSLSDCLRNFCDLGIHVYGTLRTRRQSRRNPRQIPRRNRNRCTHPRRRRKRRNVLSLRNPKREIRLLNSPCKKHKHVTPPKEPSLMAVLDIGKYRLTYAGLGWVIFRNEDMLLKYLKFELHYLGCKARVWGGGLMGRDGGDVYA